MLLALLQVCCL